MDNAKIILPETNQETQVEIVPKEPCEVIDFMFYKKHRVIRVISEDEIMDDVKTPF